ncbi:MAG: YraN family protein [Bacteroidota bacterium]|jgi:putative endonuclease|nr:YraN family protein [Sphingobacteriales bacterium]
MSSAKKGGNSHFGKLGEDIAAAYLQRKGYKILERNYRYGRNEIDIICSSDKEIIFVEVKTRASDDIAYPERAVSKAKQKNIRITAENYLEEIDYRGSTRFDIIAVLKGIKFEIEHFEDAFYPFDVI